MRGEPVAPVVWSRRNGPWRTSDVLWVGAAPGNAGGRGRGDLGAHGTRIPFGGDVAGANLDVLLGSIGLDRNHTFIVASYNRLPAKGGGEPTLTEIRAPAGDYPDGLHLLRDTLHAVAPKLIVALGNVALRTTAGALRDDGTLPSLARLAKAGVRRGRLAALDAGPGFEEEWSAHHDRPRPAVLWLTHPSAQNMSPFAGRETVFHTRMRDAREALQRAARALGGFDIPDERPTLPVSGIYALPEWKHAISPVHGRLDALWRAHGL